MAIRYITDDQTQSTSQIENQNQLKDLQDKIETYNQMNSQYEISLNEYKNQKKSYEIQSRELHQRRIRYLFEYVCIKYLPNEDEKTCRLVREMYEISDRQTREVRSFR